MRGGLFLGVVLADASRFLSGFVPAGEVAVHDVVEGRAVVGHKQVGEFVYDDVLYAPVGQEQQIDGEGDAACAVVAAAPARGGVAKGDGCRLHAHRLGVSLQQWGNDGFQAVGGFAALRGCVEWQLCVEVGALLQPFSCSLAGRGNPVAVAFDEPFHFLPRQADGCRNVNVAILCNAHGKATCTAIGDDDGHKKT